MTRSGSGSSLRLDMHDGVLCLDTENLGCHILDSPDSHGSRRMVKEASGCPGEGGKGRIGRNVRRKDASVLRCLTVNDIFEELYETGDEVVCVCKVHSPLLGCLAFWQQISWPEGSQALGGGFQYLGEPVHGRIH